MVAGVLVVPALVAGAVGHFFMRPSFTPRAVPAEAAVVAVETPPSRLVWPRGELPGLSCTQAQAVMAVVRARLPYAPTWPASDEFAHDIGMWADPTGVWTSSSESEAALSKTAVVMTEALRAEHPRCSEHLPLSLALAERTARLRADFDRGDDEAERRSRMALYLNAHPEEREQLQSHLRNVLFPVKSIEEWDRVVYAAGLRALVRLSDAHSEWAPPEESSDATGQRLYAHASMPMWDQVEPSILGAKVHASSWPELHDGDEIVWVETPSKSRVYLAGLSPEQLEQVAVLASQSDEPVRIMRGGDSGDTFGVITLSADQQPAKPPLDVSWLTTDAGDVPVLTLTDMYENVADDVGTWLDANTRAFDAPFAVLDLRGNGGGAVEPTLELLGLWLGDKPALPWTASLPSKGVVVELATAGERRWQVPVIALVDAQTASAAEMLAGTLHAYGYARLVGERTFGKGCMQEDVQLPAGITGTLSLTTSLYALPDGHTVQRAGLSPDQPYVFSQGPQQRESETNHVPPSWHGPDVRPEGSSRRWATRKAVKRIEGCDGDAAVCGAVRAALKLSPRRLAAPRLPRP